MNAPLDPLYDFRSDGYGLDDARRARMRAKVLDAIPDDASTTTTLATVATRVEPRQVPDVDLISAQPHEAVEPFEPVSVRPKTARPRWSNGRRLLVAATVAVVIGLMAVVAGTSRSTERQVGPLDDTTANVSLDELAAIAAREPDRPLAVGKYQYVLSSQAERRDDGSYDVSVDRNWHTTDGSGRRQTTSMTRPAGGAAGSETNVTQGAYIDDQAGLPWFGPFDYDRLRSAPTDPSELLDAMRAAMPNQRTAAVAEQIAMFEALTTTPPEVRATGLKALARLGFRPIGAVTDPLGRAGVGFRAETEDGTEVLAFDPSSGRALGYWNNPTGGAAPETATRWVAWDDAAVTSLNG